MNKIFLLLILIISCSSLNANTSSDCIIIKEENSIICKYIHSRKDKDREVRIEWINPKNIISRVRNVIISAGHGSIYDFRYIDGRSKGTWTFRVIDNKTTTSSTFEIE
ncbi:MAG: hypothetical protein HRT42_07265 [Campylobacteraceae bacterium]|nr:hypothetical protein [Campylobacteraceae bacterium]